MKRAVCSGLSFETTTTNKWYLLTDSFFKCNTNSRFEILVTSLCNTSSNSLQITRCSFNNTRKSFGFQLPGVYRNRKISNSEELLLILVIIIAIDNLGNFQAWIYLQYACIIIFSFIKVNRPNDFVSKYT